MYIYIILMFLKPHYSTNNLKSFIYSPSQYFFKLIDSHTVCLYHTNIIQISVSYKNSTNSINFIKLYKV